MHLQTHLAFFVNLLSKVLLNELFIFSLEISAIITCYASTIYVFFNVITPLSLKLHINHFFDLVLGLILLFGKCKLFAKFLSMNCLFLSQFFFSQLQNVMHIHMFFQSHCPISFLKYYRSFPIFDYLYCNITNYIVHYLCIWNMISAI